MEYIIYNLAAKKWFSLKGLKHAMSRVILFASTNKGKLAEVRAVAAGRVVVIASPEEVYATPAHFRLLNPGPPPAVDENADTYLGNARLKAEAFYAWSRLPALADDTGLEVASLNGEPGLFSARYAGEGCSFAENIKKLLGALESQRDRRACFRCVVFLKIDAERTVTAEGILEGEISRAPRGTGGFGYDNIFIVAGTGRTLAELKEGGREFKTHRELACERLFSGLALENIPDLAE